jgi:hypothetical protein
MEVVKEKQRKKKKKKNRERCCLRYMKEGKENKRLNGEEDKKSLLCVCVEMSKLGLLSLYDFIAKCLNIAIHQRMQLPRLGKNAIQ